jgi:hypothetical protein
MIRGVQYSKPLAAGGAAAVIAASMLIWQHHELSANISEQRRRAEVAESNLESEVAAKSMYESEYLDALRDQMRRSRVQLGDEGTWGRLVRRLGDRWSAEPGQTDEKGGQSTRYGTMRLLSPTVTDWEKIVEAVTNSEETPGVGIAELEMKTSGSRDHRTLDLVRILVAIQTSRTGENSSPAR